MTETPNQASAGNSAVASRFHAVAYRRAVPEMRRWATAQVMNTDPFDKVNAVFCRLVDREQQSGAECITDIERVVLLVWHTAGIVGNGGFHYFFECALPLQESAEAYDRIGVEQAASILRRLHDFFPGRHIPDDYDERMAIVSRLYVERADLLTQMEREFYSTDALMVQQLAGWIRVHHDVFHVTDLA